MALNLFLSPQLLAMVSLALSILCVSLTHLAGSFLQWIFWLTFENTSHLPVLPTSSAVRRLCLSLQCFNILQSILLCLALLLIDWLFIEHQLEWHRWEGAPSGLALLRDFLFLPLTCLLTHPQCLQGRAGWCCELDRIRTHLGDGPLGTPVGDHLHFVNWYGQIMLIWGGMILCP